MAGALPAALYTHVFYRIPTGKTSFLRGKRLTNAKNSHIINTRQQRRGIVRAALAAQRGCGRWEHPCSAF